MTLSDVKSIGFIGVGAMGKPMVGHLANKLPKETELWIYDVSEDAVDQVLSRNDGRVRKGASARDVADRSASWDQVTFDDGELTSQRTLSLPWFLRGRMSSQHTSTRSTASAVPMSLENY